ncbi:MAG: DNA repair protein RadC [Elusimicrobia bacterium]|nr:DNA repair protein RadC [Elusimicrobiota bacterium]
MLSDAPPHYLGHRARLRERFLDAPAALRDYELLELLLTFSIGRRDVKPIAKRLIDRFGGLRGVVDASPAELRAAGAGPATAVLVRLIKEMSAAYLEEKIRKKPFLSSPRAVADFARMRIAGLPHEAFMVIFLNVQNEVLDSEIINEGTVDQVAVYPRRILESALARHAAGLVLAHNHPSGYTEPSEEDRRLTETLRQTARALDIRVIDHLVVGQGGHCSFAERGWL